MKTQHGLTFVELMIVVAVSAILLGAALPAFSNGLEAARAAEARGSLLSSLQTTSNNAAITGVHGVLCPSSNGSDCLDTPDWSSGWIAFLDSNGTRELEAGEGLLRIQPALSGRVHLRSTVGRTRIVFQGNGGNAGSNVTFTLCDGRGSGHARALIMSNTGGLRDGAASATGITATCLR